MDGRQSKALFFDNHPDAMWIYDTHSLKFLDVNQAAINAYGYSRDEFLRMTIADIRPTEDLPALVESVRRASERQEDSGIWRHHTKSEAIIFVDIRSHSLPFEGHEARLVSARNVTRQVEVEIANKELLALEVESRTKELQRSNFLRMASQACHMGAWHCDRTTKRVTMSPEAAIIFNVNGETTTLEFLFTQCDPKYRAKLTSDLNKSLTNGRALDHVIIVNKRSGESIWVRLIGEAEFDQSGAIIAVQGAVQDITELIQAQDKSQKLSNLLTQTLESIQDGFFILDRNWRFSYINSQAEQVTGRNREDLIGKVIWDEFSEGNAAKLEFHYRKAISSGQSVFFVHRSARGDWYQVNAHPGPEGLAVYFRDITEEHRRANHLQLLETAVSRLNDILLITEAEPIDGPDGPKIVYVNDAFVRRTGYSREEVIGKTPRILQGPKTQRDRLDQIRSAMQEWKPSRAELINYTKDGKEFWLELDIVPIADEKGWYTNWVSVERDITKRKINEENIRTSEERFRLLAQVTSGAVWDWDITTGAVWRSGGFKAEFGYEPVDVGKDLDWWFERIHPEDIDRVKRLFDRALLGKEQHWHDEYRFRHKSGAYKNVQDNGFIIRDATGRAIRMIGSRLDVTEKRKMEELLRQTQKLEAIGQLTGGVAHDFNNLLTIILGNSEMLTEQLSDKSQLRLIAEMTMTAAERGAELTQRLLAFARRQPLDPKIVDINRLVANMDSLLRRTLHEHIDIEIVQSGGLWLAELDGGQVESALLNLAVNARDAMPNGGCLTIETSNATLDEDYAAQYEEVVAGQYVLLSVSDTGLGMTDDVIHRAFEPFFTTKEVGKGSGLGLSMVYGFVKQSGGHIKIYSEAGEGTTIKIYFPRSLKTAVNLRNSSVSEVYRGSGECILVVEDDEMVRSNLLKQLNSLGYAVLGAKNGPEAIQILEDSSKIDLLFTDIVMPGGINGRQLASAAMSLRPGLKVLFTSGYTENAIVHSGRLDPGVQLLSKPYRLKALAAKIFEALGKLKEKAQM